MFKGNVDDSFRLGVKMTRKTIKLFSDFYQCDLIIASPLGLRMSIEKDKYVYYMTFCHCARTECEPFSNADFLSSIEVLLIDQLNALSMQNWEHLQVYIICLRH